MKYIVPVIIIVFLAAVIFYVTMIAGWAPVLSVRLVGNISVEGRARFLGAGNNGSVYVLSYSIGNMSLTTRILVVNPTCKVAEVLDDINGVVTSLVPLRYGDEEFVAVGLYRVEGSGTRGLAVVYDGAGNVVWEFGGIKLQNITVISVSEADSFVYAGIDSADRIRVGKIYVREGFVGEAWDTVLNISVPPGTQRVIVGYDYVTRTIVVGVGRHITILDEDDGHVVLGPWNIGDIVEKIIEIPGEYIVLAREGVSGEILVLYKNNEGIWDSKQLYTNHSIVDFEIIHGEKPLIVVGAGLPLDIVMGRQGNYTGRIIVLDNEGSIIGEAVLGTTVTGVRGGFQLGRGGASVLVDYAVVNGSTTTFYTGLVSIVGSRIVWKYFSLTPIRSFLAGNHVYLVEFGEDESRIHCYTVTGLAG